MQKTLIAIAASAAALTVHAAPVNAQEGTRVFERDGSWSLDAGTDSCRLARAFSDGEETIALAFERNRADNFVRLILVGNAIRTFRAADQFGYKFLPANDQRSAMYIRSETPDGQSYFNLGTVFIGADPFAMSGGGFGGAPGASGPPPGGDAGDMPEIIIPPYDRAAEAEFAGNINAIELNEGLLRTIRLETGSLGGPIEALQACTDDLLRSWGLDWEAHQTMSKRASPVGPAWEWIPNGIVGFEDFAAFGGARNPFRVMIDAAGKPTECIVHWASLDERTNGTICEAILENGEFTPALDANGQPMASYWMTDYFAALNRPFGQ